MYSSSLSARNRSPAFAGRMKIVSPRSRSRVERVHRLRQLRHDEVRHIDDVVDRVQPDRRQPALQPLAAMAAPSRSRTPARCIAGTDRDPRSARRSAPAPAGSSSSSAGSFSVLPGDRRHLARHAVMAPQVRPVRDGLVVDLDDAVRQAARQRRARPANPSSMMPEWSLLIPSSARAGQHAVALDAVDDLLADRRVRRDHARPAVRRAADHRPACRSGRHPPRP